jgi:hypothetical protein
LAPQYLARPELDALSGVPISIAYGNPIALAELLLGQMRATQMLATVFFDPPMAWLQTSPAGCILSHMNTKSDDGHLEIEDDYEIARDSDNVDDESLLESPSDATFSITSYGADYTVDSIIARLKSEAFYVPPFQRRFVWSQRPLPDSSNLCF